MAIIVQKFGGTSVGTIERIEAVAEQIIKTKGQGHQVVAVLSAMSGETNRLTDLAVQIDEKPSARELDMLLASGEQVSIALLAIALIKRGYSAVSLLANQIGLHTNNRFNKARILSIDNTRMLTELQQGHIVIVAGFQGCDDEGNVTTLGRGGSDTSAVAIAHSLQAKECQIFTDVDGVYTTDPRIDENAKRLEHISFDEMLEMASSGAKVLHSRSVEFAGKYRMPLRVLSSFESGKGTEISFDKESDSKLPVTAIAVDKNEVLFNLDGIVDYNEFSVRFFDAMAKSDLETDMIVQSGVLQQKSAMSFTVQLSEYTQCLEILTEFKENGLIGSISWNNYLVKVSIIGNGMRSHTGIMAKVLSTLFDQNIEIFLISSSEIKISVLINQSELTSAVRNLHSAFKLN